MGKNITIADIARELNTTPATVSRALSDHPAISDSTKRSVQQTALRLNYKRNRIASSLRSGKTHLIGVLIPGTDQSFFGSLIHSIEKNAFKKGYSILLHQSNESSEQEKKGLEAFLSAGVDGILVSIAKEASDHSHFHTIKERGIPVLFFDRANDDTGISSVTVDDYKGAFLATEHLIDRGYKRIAHISGPQHLKNYLDRLNGYLGALQARKIKTEPALIMNGSLSIDQGKAAIRKLLNLPNPPDAVFASDDFTALGVILELKERKIRIPGNFGVAGFSNEDFGQYITPSLTTVDQQTELMGQSALEELIRQIESPAKEKASEPGIVLEPRLMVRESSLRKKSKKSVIT
ncbi:MAG: LacI family transcriptional regulator [Chitinophagales bacterium]|nr:LacI family transcriptional regulator [Chitinophagales bacterium]